MEPIGFALGIASLFTTCIDCFELVQSGRYLGQEYHLLETKFVNQRIRLVAWGKACGFTDPNGYDRQIDENKEVHDAIEASLLHLIGLLRDGDKLKCKYGLRDADQAGGGPPPNANALIHAPHTWPLLGQSAMTSLTQKLAKFREKTKATQQQANLWTKARWAIKDKDKFADLVQHLRDLIEDLEGLTAGLHLEHRQRELIRQEVESIREIPLLESIEEARVGRLDPVSDAASLRLWSVRDRFSFSRASSRSRFSFAGIPRDRSSSTTGGEASLDNAMSYSPAEEHSEISDDDWEALSRIPSLSPSPSHGLEDDSNMTHYQVLHRVNCDFCYPAIYMDVPDYGTECSTTNQWMVLDEYHPLHEPKTLHLCGKRLIMDLDTYLGQNRQLRFLVFREYQCRHELEGLTTSATAPKTVSNGLSVYLVSEELCVAMRLLAARVPRMRQPDFEPQAELQYPFYWVYHSRQTLKRELSGLGESTAMTLAKKLMDFISDSTLEEYSKVDELLARRVITWNTLKYLFAPDDIVVQKHADRFRRLQAYRVIDGQWTGTTDTADLALRVYYVACQDCFVARQKTLMITKGDFEDVDSEVAIEELPIVPLRYDVHITWRSLADTGKRSRVPRRTRSTSDIVGYAIPERRWTPPSRCDGQSEDDQLPLLPRRPLHNVVTGLPPGPGAVDVSRPTSSGTHRVRFRSADSRMAAPLRRGPPGNEKEKELLLSSVQSATATFQENTTAGDSNAASVLTTTSSQNKRLISSSSGGGSVYLFHGGPGTGKTFATNCISERTRKPLYHMTPFATGVSAEAVQHNMDATLALAQRWDCMLVLEDADATAHGGGNDTSTSGSGNSHVQHEVPRRAMTMALLKLLDGFGGIVVLNSSRVGVLDDALFSRVHLAIYFPELDAAGRRRIWHDAFSVASAPVPVPASAVSTRTGTDSSSSDGVDKSEDDKSSGDGGREGAAVAVTTVSEIDPYLLSPQAEQKLAAAELNGREIRNVVAQSLRIAQFQGQVLRLELVDSVLRQAVKLQEYRANLVHGKMTAWSTASSAGSPDRPGTKAIVDNGKTWQQAALPPPPPSDSPQR
ncbi:hypothetical protein PG994_003455 [Apiospora phragmitis]|uniref:Prion-inhibition and propagation HeLo domain-containing protein n=1 Tax=Apiospora phragmitis TaxID=2905665 RepID=A0ABR1VY84_9PEZI